MTRKPVSFDTIEQRISEIESLEPVTLTESEEASLAEAQSMDDGSYTTLEELKAELEGYSGRTVIRIPKSLHKRLKEEAAIEGISLNQYMLYKLSL